MAKTRSRASGAIEMLKADHDKVKKAFKDFEKLDRAGHRDRRRQIVETVCEELKVHTTLEEEIFYPALREAIGRRGPHERGRGRARDGEAC